MKIKRITRTLMVYNGTGKPVSYQFVVPDTEECRKQVTLRISRPGVYEHTLPNLRATAWIFDFDVSKDIPPELESSITIYSDITIGVAPAAGPVPIHFIFGNDDTEAPARLTYTQQMSMSIINLVPPGTKNSVLLKDTSVTYSHVIKLGDFRNILKQLVMVV